VGKRDGLQEARRLFDNLDQALAEDRISKRFKRGNHAVQAVPFLSAFLSARANKTQPPR
jgi:hypothetical protein